MDCTGDYPPPSKLKKTSLGTGKLSGWKQLQEATPKRRMKKRELSRHFGNSCEEIEALGDVNSVTVTDYRRADDQFVPLMAGKRCQGGERKIRRSIHLEDEVNKR